MQVLTVVVCSVYYCVAYLLLTLLSYCCFDVAVSMSSVNVYTKHLCLDGKPPESQNALPLPKMNQQYKQQEHKVTSPTTGQIRQHITDNAQTKERTGSSASSSDKCQSSSAVPMIELYSLSGFLSALLAQERILWDRNELLTRSFKSERI